jgi:hypothetical protein
MSAAAQAVQSGGFLARLQASAAEAERGQLSAYSGLPAVPRDRPQLSPPAADTRLEVVANLAGISSFGIALGELADGRLGAVVGGLAAGAWVAHQLRHP